jgi:2-oxo-4-hydroxy-4-carboxy-5-ureidoimidazoline decarboxylase
VTIDELDRLPAGEARVVLARCCGSEAWVERMVAERPFLDTAHLLGLAHDVWTKLTPAAWREAFTHHPRIGDLATLKRRFATTADLAGREQAGVAAASPATLEALAEGNRAYEEKFGYIFIVFASGRSADELLALLRQRMNNDPETELTTAANEQGKIMRLRLEQLLDDAR